MVASNESPVVVAAIARGRMKLAIVRTVHTFIYVVMAMATLVVLAAGVTGMRGPIVWVALSLVAAEGVVFLGNGMRCPLTTLAKKYGDPTGHVGDTLFPKPARATHSELSERCTSWVLSSLPLTSWSHERPHS